MSYALSGKRPITAATRARIEEAVAELGYQPNAGAQALAGRRTGILGLLAPRCEGPGAGVVRQFMNGILDEAGARGRSIVLLNPSEGPSGLRRVVRSALLDGVVLMDADATDPRLETLAELSTPTVVIGRPENPGAASCVDLDFTAAAALAVRHLAGHGRRRLALLASASPAKSFATRTKDGFVSAAREHAARSTVLPCHPSPAAVHDWLDAVLPDVDGIVVQNEAALPHLLHALGQRRLPVPGRVSVVAVCPAGVATAQELPVTHVDLPGAYLGAVAVRSLLRLVDDHPIPTIHLHPPALREAATCADA